MHVGKLLSGNRCLQSDIEGNLRRRAGRRAAQTIAEVSQFTWLTDQRKKRFNIGKQARCRDSSVAKSSQRHKGGILHRRDSLRLGFKLQLHKSLGGAPRILSTEDCAASLLQETLCDPESRRT